MERQISRRDFLKVALVGTASAMMLPALQGCVTAPPSAGPTGPIKLNYWNPSSSQPSMDAVLKPAADQWAAANNMQVEFVKVPYADYETKYLSAFATRQNAPDIVIGVIAYWAGAVAVADPMPQALADRMAQEVVPALHPGYKMNGQWYGAPDSGVVGFGPMLVYNPDDFVEVGLDPKRPPQTMDEMLEYARRLAKRDASGNITRSGFAHRYEGALGLGIGGKFIPFLHAFGGKVYDPETGACEGVTNSPEAVAALEYCTIYTQGEKLSSLSLGMPEVQFGQRQASMMFREGHMIGWLPRNYPGVNFEFAPVPKAKTDGMGITGVDSWGTLVYKFSPNKDRAWDFLDKVVLTAKNDLESSMNVGFVPAFKASWDSEYMKTRKDYAVQLYALEHSAGIMYVHSKNNKLADRQAQAVQEALMGKKTPKEALDQAAADMEKIRLS